MVKFLPIFVLFLALMSMNAIYALIIYMKLSALETPVDNQIQLVFLGLIGFSILLQSLVFFFVLKYLNKGKNYNKCLGIGIF